MSTIKGIIASDSESALESDAPSKKGFKFDLDLYIKECEEEEKRLMYSNPAHFGKMPENKGPSKKSHKVDQQKPKIRECKSEVDPDSYAKGQKQMVNKSMSVDGRNWSALKNEPRKVKYNKPGFLKEMVTKKPESGLKIKNTNLIARRRLNHERRRNMEKRHNLRMLKLNQLNQIASKSTSQEEPLEKKGKVCQSATEFQEPKDFNIVFLTPRVRSPNKMKESEKVNQSQTNSNISSDSSDSSSSKPGKFIMSKSELDLSIQQAVDEQFIKLKQEQQALHKLDRESEIKLKWTESKANFLMSPSVESLKSMIAIMPSVTKLVIKEKSFIPHLKLFAIITLALICIFGWIYEFGQPIERIQNAFNDLFALKQKKKGFLH